MASAIKWSIAERRTLNPGERADHGVHPIPRSNVIATIGGFCLLLFGKGQEPAEVVSPLSMPDGTTAAAVFANSIAAEFDTPDPAGYPEPAILRAFWVDVFRSDKGWKLSAMAQVANAKPDQTWRVCLGINGYVTAEDK